MTKQPGLSLLDIGVPFEKVPIGDKHVNVYGLSVESLIEIISRYPEAQKWLTPGAVKLDQMTHAAPKVIAAIIAAATGSRGIEDAEDIAGRLPIETQIDILEAMGRLTFKDGFGPFLTRIAALALAAESVNFGRVMGTNSQPSSMPLSEPVTDPPNTSSD